MNPTQFHKMYANPTINQFLINWNQHGWFLRNQHWHTIIEKNITFIDYRCQSTEFFHMAEKCDLLKFLIPRAIQELETDKDLERLKIHAKYFRACGFRFTNVLPYLIRCINYASSMKV